MFENLVRGFGQLASSLATHQDMKVTVFHGQARPAQHELGVDWRPVSDRRGRFVAETLLGLRPGQPLDALLFLNYFTPPIVRKAHCNRYT